jgi:MFS transporter, Spinster family, sphingosine-1-phosphate transporter
MSSVWFGLAVLTLINLFNYLDRYVVSALVETLKASELGLSDAQAGFLMTGFIVVYMLASPICGVLGDRVSRPKLIAAGVGLWSVATALGGIAGSFVSLFASRATVGIGEAAYGTAAPSLLADYFPPANRGRIFAIFFSAIPIGSALGYVIGGVVDQAYGWRAAFFVAGLPGLLLAVLALYLWDPPRGRLDPPVDGPKPATGWAGYRALLSNAPFVRTVLGYSFYTFALGGLAFWMPAFLERARGLPREEAVITFGAIVVVTGFVGTFAGGWLGDWLLKRTRHAYLWVSGGATLLAVPFTVAALSAASPWIFWTGIVVAELLLFASTGPVNSLIVGQVPPTQRAIALAATNFTIHVLGDVPSPPLIGWISDHSSLERAVLMVPVAVFLGGAVWTWSALVARKQQAA